MRNIVSKCWMGRPVTLQKRLHGNIYYMNQWPWVELRGSICRGLYELATEEGQNKNICAPFKSQTSMTYCGRGIWAMEGRLVAAPSRTRWKKHRDAAPILSPPGVPGNHGSSVSQYCSRCHANSCGSFLWGSDSLGHT